jgi:hypothetical protein
MTEATTAKQEEVKEEEGSRRKIIAFEIIALFFFTLSLAATIVMMLLPFWKDPKRDLFPGNAGRALGLLFILGRVFGIVLYTLGAPKLSRRILSKAGGTIDLTIGFLCAVEIFWIRAQAPGVTTSTTSLWWLCVVLTVLGTLGVYLPAREERLEDEAAKRKADEAKLKERRRSPTIIRLKVRRYYVWGKKVFDCKD